MPGVYRPYTAADIIGSLQDSIDSVASSVTSSSTSGVGYFGEADETMTTSDAATGTVLTTAPAWGSGTWGGLSWG